MTAGRSSPPTAQPALAACLLADAEQSLVQAHERVAGQWTARTYGPGEVIAVPHPAVELHVDALYADIPPRPA